MCLLLLVLLLCSNVVVSSGLLTRSRSVRSIDEWPALPKMDLSEFNASIYESVTNRINESPCPVPESLIRDENGYLPDGTYACAIFQNDPTVAQKECQNHCGNDTPYVPVSNGVGPSVICWALAYPDGDCQGQLITDVFPGSSNVTLGRCLCDVEVVDQAIEWFVTEALPLLSEVVCEMFWGIAKVIMEVGVSELPEVGLWIDAIWTLLTGVVELTNQLDLTDAQIGERFYSWLDPCKSQGPIALELLAWFDDLARIAAQRGMPVGPKRPAAEFSYTASQDSPSSVSLASQPPTTLVTSLITPGPEPFVTWGTSPAASPPAAPSATTPEPTPPPSLLVSSAAAASSSTPIGPSDACHLGKRDIGRQSTEDAWTNCDNNGIYQVTTITTIIFGLQLSTVPQACSAKWSHACAHYSSVLVVSSDKGWDKITCGDFLGTSQTSRARPAVTQWNHEHYGGWLDPKWRDEKRCDRDEYPPVYFFRDGDDVLAKTQQLIRYLPAYDNRGAGAGLWGPFYWTEGLKDPQAVFGPPPTRFDSSTVQNGKTTYITNIAISVSHRPVFTISDWQNFGGLDMSDWGLAQNPCIPAALVDDKYFPLLGSDPTLTAGPNRGQWSYNYEAPPPGNLLATATTMNMKLELETPGTSPDADLKTTITAVQV